MRQSSRFHTYAWMHMLLCLAATLAGCPANTKSSRRPHKVEQVDPRSSLDGILKLNVTRNFEARQLTLEISQIPDRAQLKCAIDAAKLEHCYDQLELPFPKEDGEHIFTALAVIDNRVNAVGEVKFRTNAASSSTGYEGPTSPNSQYVSDLAVGLDPNLRINGRVFQNGMWIRMNDTTTFKFNFKSTPQCEVTLRCASDLLDTPFKPLCNTSKDLQKTFAPGTMARGLQYLQVEASCGDHVGKPLILYWYGVPDQYTYMGLSPTIVNNTAKNQKRFIFNLMRPSDCPENKLSFKCQDSADDAASDCKNYAENPTSGFRITPICNGVSYPPYKI